MELTFYVLFCVSGFAHVIIIMFMNKKALTLTLR